MNNAGHQRKKKTEYEQVCDEMKKAGYRQTEETISILNTNVFGILISLIACAIAWLVYRQVNEISITIALRSVTSNFLLSFIVLIASIIVHELIHGLGWSISCKHGFKSIKFGYNGMPYCHCSEPLSAGRYLFGAILPFLVLGVGILICSVILSNPGLFTAALLNILAAGGDLLICISLRKNSKAKIIDHPTDPGYVAFTKG